MLTSPAKYQRPEGVSSSEEEDDEFEMSLEEFQKSKKQPVATKQRTSVSAEVYGLWNKKKPFAPQNIPKSDEIRSALQERLGQSFMFRSLDKKDQEVVINAMEEKHFNAGDSVITQGDDGDVLYFVFSGTLKCTKRFPGEDEDKFLLNYNPGMSFGELALLYNTPRAASIVASEECVLYTLDRECFNHIVRDAAIKKREIYDEFLSKVSLLDDLDAYERSKICDCLQSTTYEPEQEIITEGATGHKFFFIEEGNAYATKKNSTGGSDRVFEYGPHDYFGELALIKDVPRQASVVAQVSFDR